MPNNAKYVHLSIPRRYATSDVLQGLTHLAGAMGCTGRGAAPSASAFVVKLGLAASDVALANKLAQAIDAVLEQEKAG